MEGSIPPPFTLAEFFGAVAAIQAAAVPYNFAGGRDKPRASSVGKCGRQNAYMMAGTEPAPYIDRPDMAYTQEQGRMMEDLSFQAVDSIMREGTFAGLKIISRQISLPEDFPLTGHPDGELVRIAANSPVVWETTINGLIWGIEHKHLGRWEYERIFKQGIMQGAPLYIVQGLSYAVALGWDVDLFIITAQDASSTRSDYTTNRKAKNPANRWSDKPGWNPKAQLITVDMRPLKPTLWPMIEARALWLTKWKQESGNPVEVARDYDPYRTKKNSDEIEFPCAYCPWYYPCIDDGDGGRRAPELPFREGPED